MRIAHVVTAYAALITAFHRAETVETERSTKTDDHLSQPKGEDVTDISEITFTTLRPEVTTFSEKALWNIYLNPRKPLKSRPNHSMLSGPRGPNRSMVDRRRRQLHRPIRSSTMRTTPKASVHSSKTTHSIGRSLEIADNHIDSGQLEPIQPAEAFEEGAIHIEPIYRVTKNKNIVESLIGVLRRLVNPAKSVGPLVGPFNFPGVGDKVYIRLLEPVESDHLLIRLVTHLPASEIDATLDHSALPPSDLISHAKIPSIDHESIALSNAVSSSLSSASHIGHESIGLSNAVSSSLSSASHAGLKPSLTSSDSLLSSSNHLAHVSNPSSFNEGLLKNPFSKTYRLNLKNGKLDSVHSASRYRTVSSPLTTQNEHVDWSEFSKLMEQKNISQNPFDQTYQFHSSLNDFSKDNPLSFGAQEPLSFANISSFESSAHDGSILPQREPLSSGYSIQNGAFQSPEDQPRYSLEFTSKKMRYLNLDGSVETPGETANSGGLKAVGQGPVFPKVVRSVSPYWEPIKRSSESRGVTESSTKVKRNHRNDDEFSGTHRRSNGECSKCSSQENERKSERRVETSVNNSTAMPMQTQTTMKSTLQLLQMQKQIDSLRRNLTWPRNV